MQSRFQQRIHLLLVSFLLFSLLLTPQVVQAQATAPLPTPDPMEKCRRLAFSTEEDFMMTDSKPTDGDPHISDGDVLSPLGDVCMRNRQLLQRFAPTGALYPSDLGLDGLDILNVEKKIIAFSTEIDDVYGKFTSGDLLFTTGVVIPNSALTARFGIPYDIGLDGIQLIGEWDAWLKVVEILGQFDRDRLAKEPQVLLDLLKEYKLDIWFSIEEDFDEFDRQPLLDGDVLSALTGTIVIGQPDLFSPAVPAGIPDRGVDFGLDGLVSVNPTTPELALKSLRFSSEILYEDEEANAFNDGDVLQPAVGVVTPHFSLIKRFYPAADFLGLDALSGPVPRRVENPDPMITHIGSKSVGDINEGVVAQGTGSGNFPSGTYQQDLSNGTPQLPYRPFGSYIPVDGILQADTTEFRVMYANIADGVPHPILTTWKINQWTGDIFNPCAPTGSWGNAAPDGWFNAAQYRTYRFTPGICPNTHLVLAVWNSLTAADKDGHHIIWLEYRTTGGGATIFRESMDHHVQLDNTAPQIVNLELRTLDGTLVPPCGGAGAGVSKFNVHAEIRDKYFDQFVIHVKGGNPPNTATYGKGWYPIDLTDHLDITGTVPAGTQLVQQIDMTDLGASFVDCCYLMEMYAYETTIHHNFDGQLAYLINSPYDYKFTTFAAAP